MILARPKYFMTEALQNLWQFKTRHAFSLTIIALSFAILGVFLAFSNNLRFRAEELGRDLTVVFFLDKGRPAAERELVADEIRRSPIVRSVHAVSAEDAAQKFLADFPDLKDIVLNLAANPFPPALEVTFKDPGLPAAAISRFIGEVRKNGVVTDVQFNRDWAEKIASLGRLAGAVGFFFGGILVLASFIIVSNVIKLTVMARKSEIDILRLVGATNTFIRVPFLIEGVLLGAAGGALSFVAVFAVIKLLPVYLGPTLGAFREILGFRFLTWAQALALVGGGGAVGFIGSMSSLARFLRS